MRLSIPCVSFYMLLLFTGQLSMAAASNGKKGQRGFCTYLNYRYTLRAIELAEDAWNLFHNELQTWRVCLPEKDYIEKIEWLSRLQLANNDHVKDEIRRKIYLEDTSWSPFEWNSQSLTYLEQTISSTHSVLGCALYQYRFERFYLDIKWEDIPDIIAPELLDIGCSIIYSSFLFDDAAPYILKSSCDDYLVPKEKIREKSQHRYGGITLYDYIFYQFETEYVSDLIPRFKGEEAREQYESIREKVRKEMGKPSGDDQWEGVEAYKKECFFEEILKETEQERRENEITWPEIIGEGDEVELFVRSELGEVQPVELVPELRTEFIEKINSLACSARENDAKGAFPYVGLPREYSYRLYCRKKGDLSAKGYLVRGSTWIGLPHGKQEFDASRYITPATWQAIERLRAADDDYAEAEGERAYAEGREKQAE